MGKAKAKDGAGKVKKEVLRVVETFTRPGPMDMEEIRVGLVALQPLLKKAEGAKAFVYGPANQPIRSGLRWSVSVLCNFTANYNAPPGPYGAPPVVFCQGLLQVLAELAKAESIAIQELVSMPWGRSDPYAPVGLLQPVLALLAVLAAGKWDLSRHDPEGDVRGAKITDSLLVLVCCLARDQRVGHQMLAQGVLQSVVKIMRRTPKVAQSSAAELKVHQLITQCQASNALRALVQMDDEVKRAFLKEGIVEAVLDTVEEATAELFYRAADGPYGNLLQSTLTLINNLAVGSMEVKEAFARQSTRTAAALHQAARLPLPSAGCKDVVPGGIPRDVMMAASSLAINDALVEAFVVVGLVHTAGGLLVHGSFQSHTHVFSGADKAETEAECEAFLVYSIINFLACIVGERHTRSHKHVFSAVAEHGAAIATLRTRKHSSEGFEKNLKHLHLSLNLKTAEASEPSENLHGSLCSTVTVSEAAEQKLVNSSRSPGQIATATDRTRPQSMEEMLDTAQQASDCGNLEGMRNVQDKLDVIKSVEDAHRRNAIRWEDHQLGGGADLSDSRTWIGHRPSGEHPVIVAEYPVGGQVSAEDGYEWPADAMGYDAFCKHPRLGLVMLPRVVAKELLASAKSGAVSGSGGAGSGSSLDGDSGGGGVCTACGCPPSSGKKLMVCGRCKKGKYCSKACQARDWKQGHKRVCVSS